MAYLRATCFTKTMKSSIFPPLPGRRGGRYKTYRCNMYSYILHPTALPSVTSLETCISRNCTVPKTFPDNVTFECAVNSPAMSDPIWEIAYSQYFSGQLPLKNGWPISSGSNQLENQGYLLQNTSQNSSTLDITQQARQKHNPIQVRCIQLAEFEITASDYYYVFTYGKPIIAQLHSTLSYSKWSNVKVKLPGNNSIHAWLKKYHHLLYNKPHYIFGIVLYCSVVLFQKLA